MMGGMFPSAIPPPPLTGEPMGSSSARGHPTASSAAVSQLPSPHEDFGQLRASALYPPAGGPASIHSANLLAAQQERADLLRRMQQQQQQQQTMMHAGPMLHPLYGAPSARFHSPSALLAAREQQLQQLMLQQQQQQQQLQQQFLQGGLSGAGAAVAALGGGYPSQWVQTNESNAAEASPSRSLRVLHATTTAGSGAGLSSGRTGGHLASPGQGGGGTTSIEGGEDKTAYQVRGTFVGEITELDVLCGRGGRSNHWPGNKRYRRVISEMKAAYKSSEGRKSKTGLSRTIVDHVLGYGGRFVREEEESGRYYVLTKAEARVKTSQALREGKDLKWTG